MSRTDGKVFKFCAQDIEYAGDRKKLFTNSWRRMDMITTRIHALHAANAQDQDVAGHVMTIRQDELHPALRQRFTAAFGTSDVSLTLQPTAKRLPASGTHWLYVGTLRTQHCVEYVPHLVEAADALLKPVYTSSAPCGITWARSANKLSGRDLTLAGTGALATALPTQTRFDAAAFATFGIDHVEANDYVVCRDAYYQPVVVISLETLISDASECAASYTTHHYGVVNGAYYQPLPCDAYDQWQNGMLARSDGLAACEMFLSVRSDADKLHAKCKHVKAVIERVKRESVQYAIMHDSDEDDDTETQRVDISCEDVQQRRWNLLMPSTKFECNEMEYACHVMSVALQLQLHRECITPTTSVPDFKVLIGCDATAADAEPGEPGELCRIEAVLDSMSSTDRALYDSMLHDHAELRDNTLRLITALQSSYCVRISAGTRVMHSSTGTITGTITKLLGDYMSRVLFEASNLHPPVAPETEPRSQPPSPVSDAASATDDEDRDATYVDSGSEAESYESGTDSDADAGAGSDDSDDDWESSDDSDGCYSDQSDEPRGGQKRSKKTLFVRNARVRAL